MSAFTYLFRGRETAASPEHMQQTMEKWVAWFKELGAHGHIKDPGHPLESTGKVVKGTQKIVNDGPYAEAKDVVGGYIVVEAKDLAHARVLPTHTGCAMDRPREDWSFRRLGARRSGRVDEPLPAHQPRFEWVG